MGKEVADNNNVNDNITNVTEPEETTDSETTSRCQNINECMRNDGVNIDGTFKELYQYKTKHPKCVTFSYININSINHKIDELKETLVENMVDVLGIGETKLDESHTSAKFKVTNYRLYRKDVNSQQHGLMVYIRSDIPHTRRTEFEGDCQSVQILSFDIIFRKEKWILVFIYKPPPIKNHVFIPLLKDICGKIVCESENIIIMGDINIDMKKASVMDEVCEIYGLKNLIISPTCFKSQINPSLIDVMLVSKPRRFHESLVFDTGLSDFHHMICCCTKLFAPKRAPRKIKYRSMKKFQEEAYKKEIDRAPFHVSEIFDDVDDVIWFRHKMVEDVINHHAPLKQKYLRKESVPYMNSELRKASLKRNQNRNKYWKIPNKQNWEKYRKARNETVHVRKTSITTYFKNHCIKGDRQNFWKSIQPYLDRKSDGSDGTIVLREEDRIVTEAKEVCEVFNSYFVNIAQSIGRPDELSDDDHVSQIDVTRTVEKYQNHASIEMIKQRFTDPLPFSFKTVTVQYVYNILKNIDGKKSTGYDNIPPRFIKAAAKELSLPITSEINQCITSNHFPQANKFAEISPLFKAKDNLCKNNYRPVNILPVLSKVYEKTMAEQLYSHLQNMFSTMLSAFRKGYGCEHVLMKMTDDWKMALDKGKIIGSVSMDLSKAFDCIPHSLLVAKLHAYGIGNEACVLIASYLSNRLQRVKYHGSVSEWVVNKKGVPQGSIMGPLIFNVFINDLLFKMPETFYNYADDNNLSVIEDTVRMVLHSLKKFTLQSIEWFDENGMESNLTKFHFMIMDRFAEHANITLDLGDIRLEAKGSVKQLGLIIDRKLNFEEQITNMCKKAGLQLAVLQRLAKHLNKEDKMIIYQSYVMSKGEAEFEPFCAPQYFKF